MGGEGGKSGKGGKWRAYPNDMSGGRRHAFKVLCPDSLISSVMGPRGATKDQIQDETGCKLVFSNRDEYFPGTHFRILVIYSASPDGLVPALEKVVDHVVECATQEAGHTPANPTDADYTGKESGEYVIRALISNKMSGAIIGPRGANIQAIREDNNAKVFIDKNQFHSHQLLKVIAPIVGLKSALARINECVQSESNSEGFLEWAAVRSFTDVAPGPEVDRWSTGGDWDQSHRYDSAGLGRDRERSPRRWGRTQDREHHADSKGSKGGPGGYDLGSSGNGADVEYEVLQALAATAEEFPPGSLNAEYTITCDLPSQKVTYMIGKKGEGVNPVRQATGAKIHFEQSREPGQAQQTLQIQGPLLSVYRAHAMLMKRYHEADREAAAPPAGPQTQIVQELQEQLQALQRQLETIQGGIRPAAAAGLPGKGKGKGKKGY